MDISVEITFISQKISPRLRPLQEFIQSFQYFLGQLQTVQYKRALDIQIYYYFFLHKS